MLRAEQLVLVLQVVVHELGGQMEAASASAVLVASRWVPWRVKTG